jgi:hypothetical protein
VRDADGKPVSKVQINAKTPDSSVFAWSMTDDEGKYTIKIDPVKEPKVTRSTDAYPVPEDNNFRFLPLALSVEHHVYPRKGWNYETYSDKSRTVKGDIFVVGNSATPEDIEKLKKGFTEEKYDVIFLAKDAPLQIDFVMDSQPDAPVSWLYYPNYWVGREEDERRNGVYKKLGLVPGKQETEQSAKITASLRFPKAEIMLNEPTDFEYVVRNDSEVDFPMTVGGDYRGSGRPTSFTMRAVRKDGDTEKTVYEIPVTINMGGLTGPKKVAANGGEYAFDLCLPCWLELTEPGEYRIDVARNLIPWSLDKDTPPDERLPAMLRIASGALTVQPFDAAAFGELIETWGKQATITNVQDLEEKEREKIYAERGKAFNKLFHVEDKRVIPWLIKLAENDKVNAGENSYFALSALTKFNDDAALAAIVKNIDSPEDSKSHSAAANLSRSVHPEAIKILHKHHNHTNYAVRLTAVQAADKMERETALQMLLEHFDDPGWEGSVGKEAKRIYKELTEE